MLSRFKSGAKPTQPLQVLNVQHSDQESLKFAAEDDDEEVDEMAFEMNFMDDKVEKEKAVEEKDKGELYKILDELFKLQNVDGSYETVSLDTLLKLFGIKGNEEGKGFKTALVIMFMETRLKELEVEWKMVHLKAQQWLQKELGENEKSVVEKAKAFLG